ncbi:MAG: biopolymer transporter ExbD [Marinobacter sp.]|uniref:ExbD/TolR family protein n=1 Tax=unclassified Marinobacter TaxID=83889 RepID=UPI00273BF337|nr:MULTISPECIES: biopolymer transporter ExbD [unclassified Marinobacter]MDP4546363.1 biopolymer transporter ExbD [Marinobacter sp. MDS2]
MRRRHRRLSAEAELDITAFMNLMIVLVPVLLLGMVFSQVRMIELNFPGMDAGEAPAAEDLRLVVTVIPNGLEIADSERGLIAVLPAKGEAQDYEGLRTVLQQIKRHVPDKTDVILEVGPNVDYQTLVSVMDTVRSYPAVVATSVVEAELFPDVALMDAAESRVLAQSPEAAEGEGV